MPDQKISDDTSLTGSGVASGDLFPIVDVSVPDNKKITAAELGVALKTVGGLISGSTGSTDKAVLLANGTGGATAQASANISQDASNNLILGDSSGARELWFSTVPTAPVIRRNGAALKVIGNEGTETEFQVGAFRATDATQASILQQIDIAVNKQVRFSDGSDFNQGIGVGTGTEIKITNGSTGSGSLFVAGIRCAVVTKSANYTATDTDRVILVDCTGGAVTITLPAIATANRGREYRVKKIDASGNAVTVARSGSDTIDGATSSSLTAQYQSKDYVAPDAGSDWGVF